MPSSITKSFLLSKRTQLLLLLLFLFIFSCTAILYNLPLEPIVYAGALCCAAALFCLTIQYYRFRQRHMRLYQLSAQITDTVSDMLPEPSSLLEQDYQQIIHRLLLQNQQLLTQWTADRTQSIEYYTAWVHQIKTPITVMRMLLQEEDTAANRALLDQLFSVEQYVEMALSYARLDSQTSDFVLRQCQLDPVIRQVIRKYAAQFIHQKIQLRYTGTDVSVITDEKWLAFILEQLLSNALKYTRQGAITITADQHSLCVADTGIGIAPEDLPRIFEKGFTGYNGRSQQKSTGLGLYLCQRTAKKLNCTLQAVSQPGQGTAITIQFPDPQKLAL